MASIPDNIKAEEYVSDWLRMANEVFGVSLDSRQEEILKAVQHEKRVTVRSGHARGKDFIAAVASLCFLYSWYPSKVICTAPTHRQVVDIMMAEIGKMWMRARTRGNIGGQYLTQRIKFPDDPDWYLEGFKAADRAPESWTGYHSNHIMVVVTEASGIENETFDAIEGILTGEVSRLLIVGNPNRNSGEFYDSFRSPRYEKFVLSCLDAPNVTAKKNIIPGQVDYEWVKDKVEKWCREIPKEEAEDNDFEFEGKWYRPNDLFLPKVLGQFPREASDQLIPLRWVEAAMERWEDLGGKGSGPLRLGVDVAGMGRDSSVYTHRRGNVIEKMEQFSNPGKSFTIHMENAGRIKQYLTDYKDAAFVDTIGEGAGVHSRCVEQGVKSVSVKFSEAAKRYGRPLKDMTDERTFANMRAYCWWAVRDALDPKLGVDLALPPIDELKEDLTSPTFKLRSNGDIILEPKEDIKKRLGRSPDFGDSLANTFYPDTLEDDSGDWGITGEER